MLILSSRLTRVYPLASQLMKEVSSIGGSCSYWAEVVRVFPKSTNDNETSVVYEDPVKTAQRAARANSAEGILRRQRKYMRYEKPWMKKKRLKDQREYRAKERAVKELQMYIKYKDNNQPDLK